MSSISEPGIDTFDFYPRSYDLSEYQQLEAFCDDFVQTAVFSCLKSHVDYFTAACKSELSEVERADKLHNLDSLKELKRKFVAQYPPKGSLSRINTILLRNCVFFAWNFLLNTDQSCEGDEFVKKNFYKPTYKFSERLLQQICEYSRSEPPFIIGGSGSKHHVSPLITNMRGWEIPNMFVMYQAYKVDKILRQKLK